MIHPSAHYEALLDAAPGLDLSPAGLKGKAIIVSEAAHLFIKAEVCPGIRGVTSIYQLEGGFSARPLQHGPTSSVDIAGPYAITMTAYEEPNFPGRDTDPHSRGHAGAYIGFALSDALITPLGNGGRLLRTSFLLPFEGHHSTKFIHNAGALAREVDPRRNRRYCTRLVDSVSEGGLVLASIAQSVGLTGEDAEEFARQALLFDGPNSE